MIVQHGSFVTNSNSTYKVILDTPVPKGKSFPLISFTAPEGTWPGPLSWYKPYAILTGEVDEKYTELDIVWVNSAVREVWVKWQVVTGDEFTVQSGLTTMLDSGSMTAAIPIDAVDLNESFIVASASTTGGMAYAAFVGSYFSATDEVALSRENNYGNLYVSWYAVTMAGANVISGSTFLGRYDGTKVETISEVDVGHSFLLHSCGMNDDGRFPWYWVSGRLLSGTQVEFVREKSGLTLTAEYTVHWFVIGHPKLRVQSGQVSVPAGSPVVLPLDAIRVDRSFGLVSSRTTAEEENDSPAMMVSIELDTLDAELLRLLAGWATTSAWSVVEWTAPSAPGNLYPDTAIIPDEQIMFTWILPPGVVQMEYELEYREVGGVWQTTGSILSSQPQHIFPAGTFDLGKDYEWRVGYWAVGELDPSDFSTITSFNTRDPVIQTPTPAPDSSVKVSIRTLGATLKSPYGLDIQLTIEVDDNPDFTSATIYTLPAVSSGESATVEHAFKVAGYWHIRMTAIDTAANQTTLGYTVFAGQFIQFLGTPNVQLQSPQATHVTVRVRGTTTEYTAVREPVAPPEKAVERLVFIDSGTQATCQAVAQELIAKWGREQISVKGVIPLTLVLKPDQKVRVIIPEIGLNGELILQKKFHDVIPRSETHVELGDIMLSEQELIARIIDDLEGQSVYASALQSSYTTLQSDVVLLGQEVTESEINDIEQGQQLSDTDIQVIEMEQEVPSSE